MKVYTPLEARYWVHFITLIVIVLLLGGGVIHHLRHNLADISDNSPITWLNTNNGLESENHRADIIFYKDTCPHCQRVIPYVYLTNKLLSSENKHIEYRDINRPINRKIGGDIGDKDFPESKEIIVHNGMQHVYSQSMIQAPKFSHPMFLLTFYMMMLLFIIILLAMII